MACASSTTFVAHSVLLRPRRRPTHPHPMTRASTEIVGRRPPTAAAAEAHARRWRVARAAACVHALHVSVIYMGPSTLLSPIRQDLGLSIAEAALPLNVFRAVNCLFLLPAGAMIDRAGAFRVLWPGLVVGAVLGLLLPFAGGLTHLVVLQAAFALSKLFGGLAAMQVIVMATFKGAPDAGAAQAVTLSGWSAAGAIAPAFIGVLASRVGWRASFGALACSFLLIGIPLAYKFLRKPLEPSMMITSRPSPASSTSSSQAVREPVVPVRYAALLGVVAAMSVSLHVVLDHLVVYLREDAGFAFESATQYLSLLNIVGLLAKLIAGPLSDRFPHTLLLCAFSVLAMGSSLIFARVIAMGAISPFAALFYVCAYGLGYSGVITLVYTALPEFGLKRAGLRSNLNLAIQLGFGVFGSYGASALRTAWGSYAPAFEMGAWCWAVVFAFIGMFAAANKRSRNPGQYPLF